MIYFIPIKWYTLTKIKLLHFQKIEITSHNSINNKELMAQVYNFLNHVENNNMCIMVFKNFEFQIQYIDNNMVALKNQ